MGAAEIISALSSGIAMRFCTLAFGNMTNITTTKATSMTKKSKRLKPSTTFVLIMTNEPKNTVNMPMKIFSVISGEVLAITPSCPNKPVLCVAFIRISPPPEI